MQKTYKLIIESPNHPKGMIATKQPDGNYEAKNALSPKGHSFYFPAYIIEDRPTVWALQEPPQEEKKIVERERVEQGYAYFYVVEHSLKTCNSRDDRTGMDSACFHSGNYFKDEQVCTRAGRRASVMFQLMNIAEEVENGSTECKGNWYVISRIDESKIDDRKIIIYHTRYTIHDAIASFSTRDLAQLFHDSATDLIKEWCGIK